MGLWKDFKSRNHRESIDWVSSYIGLSLLRAKTPISNLELTANSISKRQNKNGGWGYNNETSAPDADSTAFSILFLSNFGYEAEVGKAKQFLLQHQGKDGGFGTYLPESVREDYKRRIPADMTIDGWCSSMPDVTAIALQALGNNDRAIEYMKQNQNIEGFWRAYWYNNDIYSTVQGIKSLGNHECKEPIGKAQRWLAQQTPEIPFYLALSLQGLITNNNYSTEINSGISKLIDSQEEDGSWKDFPILRVPAFPNLKPWEDSSRWRREISDQNRIFTTATCLETLCNHHSIFSIS